MSTVGDRAIWREPDLPRISQYVVCRSKAADATCAAFPDGIPEAILRNEVSHAKPVEWDNGIRLEPIEVPQFLFERITRLEWPAYAVAYDVLKHALLDLPPGAPVDASLADMLVRAELLLPHTPGEDDRRMSFTTVPVADGRDAIPLFTSVPAYEAYFGVGGPKRARLALSAFAGLGDIPVVIDPGTDLELVIDPAEIVEFGGSHGV